MGQSVESLRPRAFLTIIELSASYQRKLIAGCVKDSDS